jgi:hypothetical protein
MEPVGKALAAEFRRFDVDLIWSTKYDPIAERKVVFVNISPNSPRDWGLTQMALGAVRRDESGSSPVFIFYPAIEQMLGEQRNVGRMVGPFSPPAKWNRGLARIITHEILHILLPDRPHDSKGLFAPNFTRKTLLSQEMELDPETRAVLAERLCFPPAPSRF